MADEHGTQKTQIGIWGIGTDLVDIRRIEAALNQFGERFWRRVLNETEIAGLTQPPDARICAKRFAAKEACAKALGTGIGGRLSFHQITVYHGLRAPPRLVCSAPDLVTPDMRLDLSLADEYPYVQAFVVVSGRHS